MTEPIYDYDPAQALEGPEAIAVFVADALETGGATDIAKVMEVVVRAKGMAELAVPSVGSGFEQQRWQAASIREGLADTEAANLIAHADIEAKWGVPVP